MRTKNPKIFRWQKRRRELSRLLGKLPGWDLKISVKKVVG